MDKETLNRLDLWLLANNITIFTFPDMDSGQVFWILKQPSTDAAGKGKTLVEALENAGIEVKANASFASVESQS